MLSRPKLWFQRSSGFNAALVSTQLWFQRGDVPRRDGTFSLRRAAGRVLRR